MGDLTNNTPASDYGSLLNVGMAGSVVGLTNVLTQITDGYGRPSPLQLATNAFNIMRTAGTFQLDGVPMTAQSIYINSMCQANPVVLGTGAITVAVGDTAQRPGIPMPGMERFNLDTLQFEGYNGSTWNVFGSGTVFFLDVVGSIGLTVTGSPVVDSGTITLTLSPTLQAFSSVTGTGILAIKPGPLFTEIVITGTAGQIDVANGTGLTGDPTISIDAGYVGQTSITTLGTIGTGVWQGSVVQPTYGGTGVNNGANTLTLAGSLATIGAFGANFTFTGATNVTFPTSGTLATTSMLGIVMLDGDSGSATGSTVTINGGSTGLTTTASGSTMSLTGTLVAGNGGSGVASPTIHGVLVAQGTSPFNAIVLGAGQILIGTTSGDPVAAAIGSGSGILVGNASGAITISNTGVLSNIATANQTTVSGATGNVTIGLASNAILPGTAGFTWVTGTTAQRAGGAGTTRFNSQTSVFEGTVDGVTWLPFETSATGVTSVSGTANRITSTGGTTPVIDISAAYVGQTSLTTLGTIGTGTWQGTLIGPTYGGTGVNNGASTITIGGNHTLSGAFTSTFTLTNNTSVTFPTSGTLATTTQLPTPAALTETNDTNVTMTLGGTPTTALLQAVSMTLGWTGTLAPGRGGTGVNNGSNTLTLAGNLATVGAFASTFTMTNTTNVTFPTSGTLATTAQMSGRLLNTQYFLTSGTYTPTAGTNTVKLSGWGAGAGAGSTSGGSSAFSGSGGGGGAYVQATVANTASQTITIGAGGTGATANAGTTATDGGNTSFGSILVAAGGTHAANNGVAGGAGGTIGNCTVPSGGFAMPGIIGGSYIGSTLTITGGTSFGNLAKQTFALNYGISGIANSGQGGDGGTGSVAGGSGGSGLLIIEEYS